MQPPPPLLMAVGKPRVLHQHTSEVCTQCTPSMSSGCFFVQQIQMCCRLGVSCPRAASGTYSAPALPLPPLLHMNSGCFFVPDFNAYMLPAPLACHTHACPTYTCMSHVHTHACCTHIHVCLQFLMHAHLSPYLVQPVSCPTDNIDMWCPETHAYDS